MILRTRKRRFPPEPLRLASDTSLTDGLVFAWAGSLGVDLVGGITPTNTNVKRSQVPRVGPSWRFNGGGVGNSDLNFGANANTGNLGAGPATYAFYYTSNGINGQLGLACQNDGNASTGVGWQIFSDTSGNIAGEWGRTVTPVQIVVGGGLLTTRSEPAPVVVTFDGSNLRSGANIYYCGQKQTVINGFNGSGIANDASAQNMYLGRRNYNTALSHDGDIIIAVLANRIWNDSEIRDFSRDPFGVFIRPRAVTYSFGTGVAAPTAVFDSPDASASVASDAAVVFEVTAAAGFTTSTAKVTDSVVSAETAWSYLSGFAHGYYGEQTSILNGYQVALHRTGGWRTGALTVDLAASDS